MKYTDLVATSLDIKQYYDTYIKPINPNRYKEFNGKNLAVCPLHNDNDPSMGIVFDKRMKSKQRYHCFGCGANGDIVKLHQEILKRTNVKVLTYEESAKDLALLYHLEFTQKQIDNSALSYVEELSKSEDETLKILSNVDYFSNRDYTRQFSKLVDLKNRGGSLKSIKLNLDNLNLKLKESKIKEKQLWQIYKRHKTNQRTGFM